MLDSLSEEADYTRRAACYGGTNGFNTRQRTEIALGGKKPAWASGAFASENGARSGSPVSMSHYVASLHLKVIGLYRSGAEARQDHSTYQIAPDLCA